VQLSIPTRHQTLFGKILADPALDFGVSEKNPKWQAGLGAGATYKFQSLSTSYRLQTQMIG
jgi:hypothetical protein